MVSTNARDERVGNEVRLSTDGDRGPKRVRTSGNSSETLLVRDQVEGILESCPLNIW